MSITIAKVLKLFADYKIIAGHSGINRKVTSATVLEAPDSYEWLKGGELFVTTGYCMKDDPELMEKIVINCYKAGASGLGIKLNRFINVLPDNVIETANRLSLPIIHIPMHYTYVDMIYPVLSAIINEQTRKLQHSERTHKVFTQLVINGGDTQQIVNTLRDTLNMDVAFYDTYHEKRYVGEYSKEFVNEIKSLDLNKILSTFRSYPVDIDKINYGYIIIPQKNEEDYTPEYDEIAIEHAGMVLKLDIQKKISNMQIEARYRDEFVRDLILNNIKTIEEVNNRAKLYGWSFNTGLIPVIVDIDDFKINYAKLKDKKLNDCLENKKSKIFETAINIMKKSFNQVVYTTFTDRLVLLVEPFCDDKAKFLRELRAICEEIRISLLNNNSNTVIIGVGSYKSSVMDIHAGYENAQKAVKLGRIIYKRNKTIFFEELGIYKLLAAIYKNESAKEFYLNNLQELIEYDKRYNAKLLYTLKHIVGNDWNLKAASKDMYLHYNTIKYRFNKICEVLNTDLDNPEEKLNISVSLKLMEMAE